MKRLSLFLSFMCLSMLAVAQEVMIVENKNGSMTEFAVNEINRVVFVDKTDSPNLSNMKRLKTIRYNDMQTAELEYDNLGRIAAVVLLKEHQADNRKYPVTYGENTIKFNGNTYYLEDGKIVNANSSAYVSKYVYDGNRLVSMKSSDGNNEIVLVWENDNNIIFKQLRYGSVTHLATLDYYEDETHPIVHALFNRSALVYGVPSIEDFILKPGGYFLYPYYGTVAHNLVKHVSCTEYKDGENVYNYHLTYVRNDENDIVQVLLTTDRGSQTTYTLEWEEDITGNTSD